MENQFPIFTKLLIELLFRFKDSCQCFYLHGLFLRANPGFVNSITRTTKTTLLLVILILVPEFHPKPVYFRFVAARVDKKAIVLLLVQIRTGLYFTFFPLGEFNDFVAFS